MKWLAEQFVKRSKMQISEVISTTESEFVEYEGILLKKKKISYGFELIAYTLDKIEMGSVELTTDFQGHLHPDYLIVKPEFRGQGVSRKMYDFLKSQGYVIRRGKVQTDAGKKFWQKNDRADVDVWEEC